MKRLLLIFMAITIFLLAVGCTSSEGPDIPKSSNNELQVKDLAYDKDKKIISFKTENKGKEDIITTLHFTIEEYNEENKWQKTELANDLEFIEIALIIESGKVMDEEIDLSTIDNIPNGCYRIVKEYNTSEKNIYQYIQFEYINGNAKNLNSYNL